MRKLLSLIAFLYLSVSAVATVCPNSGYSYTDSITVDHTKVTGGSNLSNFPIYFAGNATLAGQAQLSTGVDVLFCDSPTGGNLLDYEKVDFTIGTGLGEWHIAPPSGTLSNTVDTVIYIFVGNASATDHSNAVHLWQTASYVSVYHFGTSTTLSVADAVGVNPLVTNGSTGVSHSTGQIRGAVATGFQAVAVNSAATSGLPTGTTARTMSAWFQMGSPGANANAEIACWGANGPNGDRWGFWIFNTTNVADLGVETEGTGSAFDFTQNSSWHYLNASNNSANANTMLLYLDGAVKTKTRNDSQTINTLSTNIEVGGVCGAGTLNVFSGNVDEFRINSTVLSAGWIGTEYNNQFSPTTFYTFSGSVITTVRHSGREN